MKDDRQYEEDKPLESPDDKLQELKDKLAADQKKIDDATKDRDALKAEIDALGQSLDDAKKVLAAYTAAYKGLSDDQATIDAYDEAKMGFVVCKVSEDRRDAIDGIVTRYDQQTDKLRKDWENKKQVSNHAKAVSDQARADYQAAQDNYAALKGLLKLLTDQDAALKKLMADIDGYELKKNYDAMYLQLEYSLEPKANELRAALEPVPEFKTKLYDAVSQLDKTWDAAGKAKADADDAAAKSADAKAKLDAAIANRTAELLKQVGALPPPQPAGAKAAGHLA
jgi:DNA repair exonuclease SbcCD ATPase subunit